MALVRSLLALVLCAGLLACERMPTNPEDSAQLSLQVRLSENSQTSAAQTISVVALRVTGPQMPPIIVKSRLITDSTATRTLVDTVRVLIPVGPERRFEVFLLDITDLTGIRVQSYADTTVDIPRGTTPVHLSVTLGPPPPPPLVRIFTNHGLPEFRFSETQTFFNEWITTELVPMGYRYEVIDTGFTINPFGADLVVLPAPYIEGPYTTKEGDDIMRYIQDSSGSVLFLGDADAFGSMQQLTNRFSFYFAGNAKDSIQYISLFDAPIVTHFGAADFLTPGDTLILAGGLECLRFDSQLTASLDTVAKLSPGGWSTSDVLPTGPPAVAFYGRSVRGQFVAVGDMDWIGPTRTINVAGTNFLIPTGLHAAQHAKLARLILLKLAPPVLLDVP